MTPATQQAAFDHAMRTLPREACGLVVIARGREVYHPCRNVAENDNDFIMHPEDYAAAEDMGDVMAVVHSHPNASANPSMADRVSCAVSGLPWHIVSVPGNIWRSIEPDGYKAPLIGREFSHGNLDCYSLVRDWFREERGIEIPDFDRSNEWWNKGQNLYLDNFTKAGFERVPDGEPMLPGDGILMRIRSIVPNHAAIYLGDDVILHHLQNRLSCRDIWGGYWQKHCAMVVRYKGST